MILSVIFIPPYPPLSLNVSTTFLLLEAFIQLMFTSVGISDGTTYSLNVFKKLIITNSLILCPIDMFLPISSTDAPK